MAFSDLIEQTKTVLYGQGLGEKPALVLCAADANEVVTGETLTFDLATGEGVRIHRGDILSRRTSDGTDAYCFYVLDVATDTVTALNSYKGAPAAADTNLDGRVLEINPFKTDNEISTAIKTVVARFLYPQVFKLVTHTVTSDVSDGEAELPATVEDVISAHQIIATKVYPIPFGIQKNLDTSVSSTGVLGYFDFYDNSDTYVTAKEKYLIADIDETLEHMVAVGAAAILLGASVAATDLERAKKDSQKRQPESAASVLWRDFLTLKTLFADEISRDVVTQFIVYRG